jgi:hypothetical protein
MRNGYQLPGELTHSVDAGTRFVIAQVFGVLVVAIVMMVLRAPRGLITFQAVLVALGVAAGILSTKIKG